MNDLDLILGREIVWVADNPDCETGRSHFTRYKGIVIAVSHSTAQVQLVDGSIKILSLFTLQGEIFTQSIQALVTRLQYLYRHPVKSVDDTSYDIYALVDPRDSTIRYVGMSKNAKKRFWQHITCSGNNLSKNAWILDLHRLGLHPSLQIIETVEGKARALTHEEYWICFYAEKQSITNFNHNLGQIDVGTRIDRFIPDELLRREEVGQ